MRLKYHRSGLQAGTEELSSQSAGFMFASDLQFILSKDGFTANLLTDRSKLNGADVSSPARLWEQRPC